MVTLGRTWSTWLCQGLTIAYVLYLIVFTLSVDCATTRQSRICRNETNQIVVNQTVEEWCAGVSSVYCWAVTSCYCNYTREVTKKHVTEVCKDGDDEEGSSGSHWPLLTDAEVAAIAVISSLVFSILLSLTVFGVQRRHRASIERKNARTLMVQVERGGAGEAEVFIQSDPFSQKQYIHVQPANREQNVYEDSPSHAGVPAGGTARLNNSSVKFVPDTSGDGVMSTYTKPAVDSGSPDKTEGEPSSPAGADLAPPPPSYQAASSVASYVASPAPSAPGNKDGNDQHENVPTSEL